MTTALDDLFVKTRAENRAALLALAKSFAELHGGTLAVRSTEGTGTTVLVRLPIREGPIEVAA